MLHNPSIHSCLHTVNGNTFTYGGWSLHHCATPLRYVCEEHDVVVLKKRTRDPGIYRYISSVRQAVQALGGVLP